MGSLSDVRWGRVLVGTIGSLVLSFLIGVLIVTLYASYLAFQVRGAPDQGAIQGFATSILPWLSPLVTFASTFFMARWAAKGAASGKQINGLIVGILVAVVGLVLNGFSFAVASLLDAVIAIVAGWVGGRAA